MKSRRNDWLRRNKDLDSSVLGNGRKDGNKVLDQV